MVGMVSPAGLPPAAYRKRAGSSAGLGLFGLVIQRDARPSPSCGWRSGSHGGSHGIGLQGALLQQGGGDGFDLWPMRLDKALRLLFHVFEVRLPVVLLQSNDQNMSLVVIREKCLIVRIGVRMLLLAGSRSGQHHGQVIFQPPVRPLGEIAFFGLYFELHLAADGTSRDNGHVVKVKMEADTSNRMSRFVDSDSTVTPTYC